MISDLKQTGTVQKYLSNINRLNIHAKMTDHHLINIMLNSIITRLCQPIAQQEDLPSGLSRLEEKPLYMNFITTSFEKKEQNNGSKSKDKGRGLEEQVQLRGGEAGSEKKKGEFVPKEVKDKRKVEGRCIKHKRSYHQAWDCNTLSRAKKPPFPGDAKQEPAQKKRKFDKGHLKIIDLGSEEDLRNQ